MFPPARDFTPDHIAILRRLRGISQRDLAQRLGMRQPELSELERGRRPVPADFEPRLWQALAR
jgi:transcriptional regulator with XRE-family HTH domain